MAEGDPAPVAVPPAPPAPKPASKHVHLKVCPFCKETKPNTHPQWCKANPNRRTDNPKRAKKQEAKKAPAKRAVKKPVESAPKPKDTAAFVKERGQELRATSSAKSPSDDAPDVRASDDVKPRKGGGLNYAKAWPLAVLALALIIGAYVFFQVRRRNENQRRAEPEREEMVTMPLPPPGGDRAFDQETGQTVPLPGLSQLFAGQRR